ncbi:MAG: PEPxxWA-CTERM sorting domain-containing protein [Azoarcus sp.]|nr:PEPxxWA-CTERM sorting domain-containing protein [Azoarcus sp.]
MHPHCGGRKRKTPEPETWAMLQAGSGLVGGIARRRRGLRA